MLLGSFVKELRHNSLWLFIYVDGESQIEWFSDTLGVLLNSVKFQKHRRSLWVDKVVPIHTTDLKPAFKIYVHKRYDSET